VERGVWLSLLWEDTATSSVPAAAATATVEVDPTATLLLVETMLRLAHHWNTELSTHSHQLCCQARRQYLATTQTHSLNPDSDASSNYAVTVSVKSKKRMKKLTDSDLGSSNTSTNTNTKIDVNVKTSSSESSDMTCTSSAAETEAVAVARFPIDKESGQPLFSSASPLLIAAVRLGHRCLDFLAADCPNHVRSRIYASHNISSNSMWARVETGVRTESAVTNSASASASVTASASASAAVGNKLNNSTVAEKDEELNSFFAKFESNFCLSLRLLASRVATEVSQSVRFPHYFAQLLNVLSLDSFSTANATDAFSKPFRERFCTLASVYSGIFIFIYMRI